MARAGLFSAFVLSVIVLAHAASSEDVIISDNFEAPNLRKERGPSRNDAERPRKERVPRVKCGSKCFTGHRSLKKAQRTCRGKKPLCKVQRCRRVGRGKRADFGYSCAFAKNPTNTTPTPTATPSPAPSMAPVIGPIAEGPIAIPESIMFPPDVSIGGTIEVEVTVVLDDVSSSVREDIYLLSDATGSMTDQIETVKDRFGMLVDARRNASGDVAFGVGYYRDEEDKPAFENLQSLTKNLGDIDVAINKLEAEAGGDIPEANLFALSQVATQSSIGWREGSRKILVYFGDAPGHEPTCPAGSPQLTRDVVVDQLNERGIAVVATNFETRGTQGLNSPTFSARGPTFGCPVEQNSPAGQATRITDGTLGALKTSTNPTALVNVITETIGSLDQELSAETMDCAGRVAIVFTPDLPISIAPGETKTIFEKIEILPGACEFPEGFTCTIDINLSGVGVKQTIQTTSIAGCVPFDDGFGGPL